MLRVYPVYTVIAKKYQAMVMLCQANSRMKDFYDLAVIGRRTALDEATLASVIAATFTSLWVTTTSSSKSSSETVSASESVVLCCPRRIHSGQGDLDA